jgi:hypothetical protein
MTISFSKHPPEKVKYPDYWYLDHPTWRGNIEDLRLPTSFNSLIEEESGISSRQMIFEISESFLPDGKKLKRLMHEEMDGGRYDSMYGEVFICDMLLLYFPGGYPYKIYYKIKE